MEEKSRVWKSEAGWTGTYGRFWGGGGWGGGGRLQFGKAHADEERSLCSALSYMNPPGGDAQRRAVHRSRPADPSAASVQALHPTDLRRTRGAELGGPG